MAVFGARLVAAACWLISRPVGALRIVEVEVADEMKELDLYHSFCVENHSVPRSFIFGLPKPDLFFEDAASQLRQVTNVMERDVPSKRSKAPWIHDSGFDTSLERYLEHFPHCERQRRFVTVDATSKYFSSLHGPSWIHDVYGQFGLVEQLRFVVFLRNPLLRTQAHYYNYVRRGVLQGGVYGCSQFPASFQEAVRNRVHRGSMCNCSCDDVMEDSMYVNHLERYFGAFPTSDFQILPYAHTVGDDVIRYVWNYLSIRQALSTRSRRHKVSMRATFPAVPEITTDLDPQSLADFTGFMLATVGPKLVGQVLAKSSAHLYRFQGRKRTSAKVNFWLTRRWGNTSFWSSLRPSGRVGAAAQG